MESIAENMQNIDEAYGRTARSRTMTACSQCQKRKQKCSREQPCRHCSRRYPPVECIYTLDGRHNSRPNLSPNSLYVPEPTFYMDSEIPVGRNASSLNTQNSACRKQSYGYGQGMEQTLPDRAMNDTSLMPLIGSESCISQTPYQTMGSSIPSSNISTFPSLETDRNAFDFPSSCEMPILPSNNGISNYDIADVNMGAARWNTSGMSDTDFPSFDLGYIPIPTASQGPGTFGFSESSNSETSRNLATNGPTDSFFVPAPNITYSQMDTRQYTPTTTTMTNGFEPSRGYY